MVIVQFIGCLFAKIFQIPPDPKTAHSSPCCGMDTLVRGCLIPQSNKTNHFLRTFSVLPKDFLQTFSGISKHSQDFFRTLSELSQNIQSLALIALLCLDSGIFQDFPTTFWGFSHYFPSRKFSEPSQDFISTLSEISQNVQSLALIALLCFLLCFNIYWKKKV